MNVRINTPYKEVEAFCRRNRIRRLAFFGSVLRDDIAFPTFPTGAFNYPMEPAARVAFKTMIHVLPRLSSVKHIRFVLFQEADARVHERVLKTLIGSNDTE